MRANTIGKYCPGCWAISIQITQIFTKIVIINVDETFVFLDCVKYDNVTSSSVSEYVVNYVVS